MPIDDSTWKQAAEQDSTATQLLEFLRENQSAAYTTNELVEEIVPEETGEGVVAYYRAVLEALVREGSVEKREIAADTDAADLIPYYRAAENESSDEAREQAPSAVRDVPLDRPVRVRMAEDSGAVPVRIESGERPATNAPFFVRWYRWYRRTWRRAAQENRIQSNE